jgi:hypothetical protein
VAADTLTLRMRATGGRSTRRELKATARETRDVGGAARDATRDLGIMDRAMRLLGTRMGMLVIVGALLTVTLGPPMLAAVALLTAAVVTLGGVFAGVFLVGAAVVNRFKQTVGSAGSAAYDLKNAFDGVKTSFSKVTAVGADKVLRAVAYAIKRLAPLLDTIAPAFTVLAESVAGAVETIADGLIGLGPQLNQMLTAAGTLVLKLANGVGPLVHVLLSLGTAGIPVLGTLVDWIVKFLGWLAPAIDKAIAWERSTHTLWGTLQIFGGVVSEVAGFIADLGSILYDLGAQTAPFWKFVGSAAIGGLYGIAGAVDSVSNNMDDWGPVIEAVAAAWVAYKAAITGIAVLQWAINAATAAWVAIGELGWIIRLIPAVRSLAGAWFLLDAAMSANVVGVIVLAIAAIALGLYEAYQHVGWFHNAVDKAWDILKSVGAWVLNDMVAAFQPWMDAIKWVVDQVKWLIDHVGEVTGKIGGAAKAVQGVKGPSGIDIVKGVIGGRADGGPINRSGPYLVGERGPEVVDLPNGSNVTPGAGGGGTEVINIHATLVTPDGDVLARQTLRAARRKRSLS